MKILNAIADCMVGTSSVVAGAGVGYYAFSHDAFNINDDTKRALVSSAVGSATAVTTFSTLHLVKSELRCRICSLKRTKVNAEAVVK